MTRGGIAAKVGQYCVGPVQAGTGHQADISIHHRQATDSVGRGQVDITYRIDARQPYSGLAAESRHLLAGQRLGSG